MQRSPWWAWGKQIAALTFLPRRPKRIGFWIVFTVGSVITALITFPNQYNFRIYGFDLGYILQIVHLISRGEIGYYISSGEFMGIYAEPHYTLFHLWLVPLYLVFGVLGLLITQWLGVLWAAVGVYKYAHLHLQRDSLASISMAQFFGMWGVLALLSFDVHEFTTVALPWVFYFLEQQKTTLTLLSWIIFITTKENIALWSIWMVVFLAILYKKPEQRKILLKLGVISLVWVGLSWGIAHWLRQSGHLPPNTVNRVESLYGHWIPKDTNLPPQTKGPSSTLYHVALRFLREPQLIATVFFQEYEGYPKIKQELYLSTLASGGWSLILQPIFLVILLPVYFYKFTASDCQVWGIFQQYNMEFAVLLPIAVVWTIRRYKLWLQASLLALSAIGAWIIHFYANNRPYSCWFRPGNQRWYECRHYQSPFSYERIHAGLKHIPREAPVSAVSILMPHIPPRRLYYHFPARLDTVDYIAMVRHNPNPWPLSKEEDAFWIDSLSCSPAWEKNYDQDKLVIFRRRAP